MCPKCSVLWNPWHPSHSAHDFEQNHSACLQMKTWINLHLMCGLNNFQFESFQSPDALWKLLSELYFKLGNGRLNEDHSHIFRTLYFLVYQNIYICFWNISNSSLASMLNWCFLWTQKITECTVICTWAIHLAIRRMVSPLDATIIHIISTSDNTHLTDSSVDQHASPLYFTVSNVQNDICTTPRKHTWILFVQISNPLSPKWGNTQQSHAILRLELCCPHSAIVT